MNALVIAGTRSGVGKTSIALGICRSLARRGVPVRPAKVGPDYLDPTHLSRAAGAPCLNLDPWMMGEDWVRTQAAGDGLLLVEGVMGLYDGADARSDSGSTAHVSRLLDAPVWLVVEAKGCARSFAAAVLGFCRMPEAPRITGIIANRCGGERHAAILADALDSLDLPPLIAAIPEGALPTLASRHLGLVSADEDSDAHLDALANAIDAHLERSWDRAWDRARPAHPGQWTKVSHSSAPVASGPRGPNRTLALAWDAAFHFAYADLWPALAEHGVTVVRFSPLHDSAIPAADGLYLPGGYPEEHADTLAQNTPMLAALRDWHAADRPLYAECGGLMLLSQGIELKDGRRLPLAGVLPAWTRMLPKRRALGYAEVRLTGDTLIGKSGDLLRGHEFHYSELVSDPGWERLYDVTYRRGESAREGFRRGRTLASYVHLHLASRPTALARFAESLAC